jgi:hypothetical protein
MNTKIYENDDSDDEVEKIKYCKLAEDKEFGGLTGNDKMELKEYRTSIINLCNSILEITSSNNLKISQEHITELHDYISDCFMWMHSHEQPTLKEYKMKLDEINEQCDIIFNQYNGDVFIQECSNKKDELENLCYILEILINENKLFISKEQQTNLFDTINTNLHLIHENNISNDECEIKLRELNDLCNKLEQSTHSININKTKDVLGQNREKVILSGYHDETHTDDSLGSDIISLMRKKQQSVIESLINEE